MIKVLVVEDEKSLRDLLKIGLSNPGYKIFLAENGEEAKSVLNKKAIDIVVTDFEMPKMNGLELIKFLRINYSSTPVIMMSSDEGKKNEALNSGARAFVPKKGFGLISSLSCALQDTLSENCRDKN